MDLSFQAILAMVRTGLVAPRQSLREVLALGIAPRVGWLALILMAVLSALLSHVSFALMQAEAQSMMSGAMASPIRTALIQWAAMILSVHLIHRIGRARGGRGSLGDTVVAVAWLQVILLALQVLQLICQIALPMLGNMASLASLVLFFWLLTNFVAELHGFTSLGKTFAVIMVVMFSVAFVLAFVFAMVVGVPQPGV